MRRRTLVNLVLLAAVAGLAATAVLLPNPDSVPEPATRLSTIDPERIHELAFTRKGRAPLRFERVTQDRWKMLAPYTAAAATGEVERLAKLLAAPTTGGFRAAGNDLAQYGLDPPRGVVVADDARFAIGDTDPINGRRYVLHDDEVGLVVDEWFAPLALPAARYVDRAPLGPDAHVVAIELDGLKLTLVDGRWRVEPDRGTGADAPVALAEAWERARALDVEAYDPAREWHRGARVRIAGHDGWLELDVARTARELVFGSAERGLEYHLARDVGERLLRLDPVER